MDSHEGSQVAGIVLTDEQEAAANQILSWAEGHSGEFCLGGYAGTGKTTLLNFIRSQLNEKGKVVVLAPTGKAAEVLRRKGVKAETVHSFFYRFLGVSRDSRTGDEKLEFAAKAGLQESPQWIIIDEASMVNAFMAQDIRKHGIPILWVGDHGQLPPIGPDPGIMEKPNAKLQTIHRQAKDNPILLAAQGVRLGSNPSSWLVGNDSRRAKSDTGEFFAWSVRGDESVLISFALENEIDQIIVGRNRTRHSLNRKMRERLGFPSPDHAAPSDKVICLKNNRRRGIFNGMIFEVEDIVDYWKASPGSNDRRNDIVVLDVVSDSGKRIQNVPAWAGQWLSDDKLADDELEELEALHADKLDEMDINSIEFFDFGYAITCHKSQGSEWPKVLVIDEPIGKRNRWRYTAITRASDYCSVAIF